jgi:hypothetical protein
VPLQMMPSHLFLRAVMSSLYCFSRDSQDISVQFWTCLDDPCNISWLNEGIMTVYSWTKIIILWRIWNSYLVQLMKCPFRETLLLFKWAKFNLQIQPEDN